MKQLSLKEKEDKYINSLTKAIYECGVSNDFLLQIIELAGDHLNLCTIPEYSKRNNISYNGVKNHRHVVELIGCKFVVDND